MLQAPHIPRPSNLWLSPGSIILPVKRYTSKMSPTGLGIVECFQAYESIVVAQPEYQFSIIIVQIPQISSLSFLSTNQA